MREIFTDEFGQVKLDGQLLPGVFQGAEISGTLRVDEQEVPGRSGRPKQPLGFDTATVTLRLKLPTDENYTCYERVQALVRLFRAVDNKARPYVRRIVNKHCQSWGITQVVFKELRTTEDNNYDYILADLVFSEWQPAVVRKEEAIVTPSMADFRLPAAESSPAKPETPAKDDDSP